VEDDPDTRAAVRELLVDAGFTCSEAEDGVSALATISNDHVDLVLLDLALPRMSGTEVREAVRHDPRHRFLPIIFLSAHGDREARLAELSAGADDYITKPYDADELIARVNSSLRRSNGLRALNPLSGLPGNMTITEEIERRLASGDAFALLYADIDRFKEFNDYYGFLRGDVMIARLAELLERVAQCGGKSRFVGHIGGDDFVLLADIDEAESIAEILTRRFDEMAPELYDQDDRMRASLEVRDRRGRLRRTALASLSVGVVNVPPGRFDGATAAARAAAEMKEVAKRRPGSTWAVDRRKT